MGRKPSEQSRIRSGRNEGRDHTARIPRTRMNEGRDILVPLSKAHPHSKMATRGDGHVSSSEQSPLCQLLGFGPVSLWVSVTLLGGLTAQVLARKVCLQVPC